MMNHCKDVENINKLLINILKFYANPENYDNGQVMLDRGVQADYAIKTTKEIMGEYLKAEDDYSKAIEIIEKETEFLQKLNDLKNT